LVFPKDDTYRELVFCKDTFQHLNTLLKRLENTDEIFTSLEEMSNALFKIFDKVYKFLNNNLEGTINSDYDIDEIVEYRQEMVAKAGILDLILDLLQVCIDAKSNNDMDEEEWAKDLTQILKLSREESSDMENVLELMFETLHTLFTDNTTNQYIGSKNIDIMQSFVFVKNMSKVLIQIFKDKQFEMNKKEIHTEIMYRRIYEYDRFHAIVQSFIKKLLESGQHKYIYILRKI